MIALRVENLSKSYRLGRRANDGGAGYLTLREELVRFPKRLLGSLARAGSGNGTREEEFYALRDVNFEVQQGEVLGVIGRNGAGKSTLLKILSRITEPTAGRVEIHGRVASLLEVGTGFHPELTGRENIFLNGAILGMRRTEIKAKFDEIVAFAEVEKFLDTPVKRYSSGMYVRLAFAVAAHLEPEILIVDEVLAVGDAEFQKKCLGKMQDVSKKQGRTVLFVSHQMNAVQTLCNRCLLLMGGQLHANGNPSTVIGGYLRASSAVSKWRNTARDYTNPYFVPTAFSLVDQDLQQLQRAARADEAVGVLLEGQATILDSALVIGFAVYTVEGALLYWSVQTDTPHEDWPEIRPGPNRMVCWLPQHMLNEGEYRVELIVSLHCRAWICQPGVNAPALHLELRGGLSQSPHWMAARPGLLGPILPFEPLPA
jgi:lipopolysaccharide transport system ATP-binding protein